MKNLPFPTGKFVVTRVVLDFRKTSQETLFVVSAQRRLKFARQSNHQAAKHPRVRQRLKLQCINRVAPLNLEDKAIETVKQRSGSGAAICVALTRHKTLAFERLMSLKLFSRNLWGGGGVRRI